MAQLTLNIEHGKRWWFPIAFRALLIGCRLGLVRDTERYASWLVEKGMWFRCS